MTIKIPISEIEYGHEIRPMGELSTPVRVIDQCEVDTPDYGLVTILTVEDPDSRTTVGMLCVPAGGDVRVTNLKHGHIHARNVAEVNEILTYLPSNYRFHYAEEKYAGGRRERRDKVDDLDSDCKDIELFIRGMDVAGWTMADYVIMRLASGMHYCTETTGEVPQTTEVTHG